MVFRKKFPSTNLARLRLNKSRTGFTLLEVILAITILTLAIFGSFSLISQTLIYSSALQSKLIASFLAQEGIELVRNIRDSNWLKQRSESITWDAGMSTGDYQIDYNDAQLFVYEDEPLNLDLNGFYSYAIGSTTPFKRKITITKINDAQIKVLVDVEWTERFRIHHFSVSEHLYNWHGY